MYGKYMKCFTVDVHRMLQLQGHMPVASFGLGAAHVLVLVWVLGELFLCACVQKVHSIP
jgi:hypothetical protein